MKKAMLVLIVLAAMAAPVMARGGCFWGRPVYSCRPVYPMYGYPVYGGYQPAFWGGNQAQPAPDYRQPPIRRVAPPQIRLVMPEGFVEVGRDYHGNGTIDWIEGAMADGSKWRVYYNPDGTIHHKKKISKFKGE